MYADEIFDAVEPFIEPGGELWLFVCGGKQEGWDEVVAKSKRSFKVIVWPGGGGNVFLCATWDLLSTQCWDVKMFSHNLKVTVLILVAAAVSASGGTCARGNRTAYEKRFHG